MLSLHRKDMDHTVQHLRHAYTCLAPDSDRWLPMHTYIRRDLMFLHSKVSPSPSFFCPFLGRYIHRKKPRFCRGGKKNLIIRLYFPGACSTYVLLDKSTNAVKQMRLISLFCVRYSGWGKSWQIRKFFVSSLFNLWLGFYSRCTIIIGRFKNKQKIHSLKYHNYNEANIKL